MKKRTKISLIGAGLFITTIALSSCTASFCSDSDTAKIMYTFERGVTRYYDESNKPEDAKVFDIKAKIGSNNEFKNENFDNFPKIYYTSTFDNSKLLRDSVIPTLKSNNYFVPTLDFFEAIDEWVLKTTLVSYLRSTKEDETPRKITDITSIGTISVPVEGEENKFKSNFDQNTLYGVLNRYGYQKFYTEKPTISEEEPEIKLFDGLKEQIETLRKDPVLGPTVPGNDFINVYQNALTQTMSTYRSCIFTVGEEGDIFGMYGDPALNNYYEQIEVTKKDWGYAWSKGFFEGLLIYPISALVDAMTTGFSGGNLGLIEGNGWAQVGAILLVTIILRTIIMLASLKTTLGQARMQKLQPQLAKLQEKYPNSNTNQYEKQRLAQEQMALYKKNKVSPFGQLIVMIVQFPVFICVWGALSGSSALSTGTFYNMNLADTVWNVLSNTAGLPSNVNGWWTAFVLIILMTLFQVAATLVPLLIQSIQRKKVEKLGKNNAVAKQNKTMKIVQFVMLAMIIFMGFTLPAAMGVYWIAGAIFSLAQTLITFAVNNRKDNKNAPSKKEPKKEETINEKVVLDVQPVEEIETSEEQKEVKNNKKKKNNYKEFKYPKKRGGRR